MGFAFNHQDVLQQDYDLVIATSMVDLSSLRGFCPNLANTPTIVYFHENQFAYPVPNAQQNLVAIQLTSIYSALCANRVIFNSRYNRDTFVSGAQKLLMRLPDEVPKGLVEKIEQMSEILAVPISTDVTTYERVTIHNKPVPEIVWNHRWEYDKQPDVFFKALTKLKEDQVDFKLHLLGQSFRNSPECFHKAKEQFKEQIISYGYCERDKYLTILAQADVVVSSSLHDFQGLSMQEAIILGCVPVAPNRVAYPEYIEKTFLYDAASEEDEVSNLHAKLKEVISGQVFKVPDLKDYYPASLIPLYRDLFNKVM